MFSESAYTPEAPASSSSRTASRSAVQDRFGVSDRLSFPSKLVRSFDVACALEVEGRDGGGIAACEGVGDGEAVLLVLEGGRDPIVKGMAESDDWQAWVVVQGTSDRIDRRDVQERDRVTASRRRYTRRREIR